MKFGTLLLNNRIYDLDYMKKEELEALVETNLENKKAEIVKAKKICKREMDENLQYVPEDIPIELKKFLDNSGMYVKSDAIIQRALVQKSSYDVINNKIKSKRNSINASIKSINSKFNKNSKRFDEIQTEINSSLKKYESILYEVADFYDTKIEQLILRKLEIETNLVGTIIKDEYLLEEANTRNNEKENDKLLLSLSSSVKSFISKLTKKKEQKEIDVTMISNWQDKTDLEAEQNDKLKTRIEKTENQRKENSQKILEFEEEILSIEKEIDRLNYSKEKTLVNAMESEEKSITIIKRNRNFIGKIRNFFVAKFNTANVILDKVIKPFNDCMISYEENIVEDMKE